jgi:hypothetical protein
MTTYPLGHVGNIADRAGDRTLSVDEVIQTDTKILDEEKDSHGNRVLYNAAAWSSIEVTEAILDKGVDVNALSKVKFINNQSLW